MLAEAGEHVDRFNWDKGRNGSTVSIEANHSIVDLSRFESFRKIGARFGRGEDWRPLWFTCATRRLFAMISN